MVARRIAVGRGPPMNWLVLGIMVAVAGSDFLGGFMGANLAVFGTTEESQLICNCPQIRPIANPQAGSVLDVLGPTAAF